MIISVTMVLVEVQPLLLRISCENTNYRLHAPLKGNIHVYKHGALKSFHPLENTGIDRTIEFLRLNSRDNF